MTTASLGLRSSGSYGSLQQQQFQNGGSPFQASPPVPPRKPPKMFKEKEGLFLWICKFAPRKKIGMMLLCIVSAAVFLWVLYVGKVPYPYLGTSTKRCPPLVFTFASHELSNFNLVSGEDTQELIMSMNSGVFPPDTGQIRHIDSIEKNDVGKIASIESPPPPPLAYFKGYTLPPGNPCEGFTLPPPPADKKRTGPRPCPVCYLPVEQAIALMPDAPSFSPGVSSLTYIHEENLSKSEFGGSEFGGHPSLMQRNDSYDVRESMSVHCGFVRGARPGHQTGFDIDDSNLLAMESCRGVVVASAIFGAFDLIRQPQNISEYAKGNVCFYMFVDEETENFLINSSELDSSMRIGLWRIAVVHNLPYDDPRRNGKVPKLLLHRLFPNARYSLWVDAKLELVVDPYQMLERDREVILLNATRLKCKTKHVRAPIRLCYQKKVSCFEGQCTSDKRFLWRKNASFAISRHYRRFDVFVEAEANKAASKFDNASIDFQVDFYRKEGLTPYTRAKLPISSDVPEGCVIIKEHIPISNLFTCLWFNEVDRFTPRDQISFAIVRDKIREMTNWTLNMFLDCERRNFVIQGYHRDVLERWPPPPPPGAIAVVHPPPPAIVETLPNVSASSFVTSPIKKIPTKRGRERKSRRHRKVIPG